MEPAKKQKLYCYVDETRQDTLGALFIVSVVVSGANKDDLAARLEAIERESGKGKVKWTKARARARLAYINAVLSALPFKGILYFSVYTGTKSYMALTVLSTAKAVLTASPRPSPTAVYVDGLPKSRLRWFGTELRRLSVQTSKVAGVRREETDPLIRLADAGGRIHAGRPFGPAARDGATAGAGPERRLSQRSLRTKNPNERWGVGSLSSSEAPASTGSVRLPNQLHLNKISPGLSFALAQTPFKHRPTAGYFPSGGAFGATQA
jgi:hypothetical protein